MQAEKLGQGSTIYSIASAVMIPEGNIWKKNLVEQKQSNHEVIRSKTNKDNEIM